MSWARIERRRHVAAAEGKAPDSFSDYMDRLLRLIPSEVIGIYITIRAWAQLPSTKAAPANDSFFAVWPVVCLLLVIALRAWGTSTDNFNWRTIQYGAVIIAAVSFVLWVYALG